MMAEPLVVDPSGWLNLPEAPGMGYEVNASMLERTRVR